MPTPQHHLQTCSVTLGCDPEFFLTKSDGTVVGSEIALKNVFDEDARARAENAKRPSWDRYDVGSTLVEDGVQVEINPPAGTCRESLAMHIRAAFTSLHTELKKGDFSACFNTVIEMDPKELERLSEKAKKLGCAPSLNSDGKKHGIKVDGAKHLTRSAGGHIHLGLSPRLKEVRPRLIDVLDILLGNTCVMIDRDPRAAERRKLYGRAGEYRTPAHGVEYRTLSNFWLRAYPLMSFVMGVGRQGVHIMNTAINANCSWNPEKELLDTVDLKACKRAINKNDLKLARENWRDVQTFFKKAGDAFGVYSAINAKRLSAIDFFLKGVSKEGLAAWFPQDPVTHWTHLQVHNNGWESFIDGKVPRLMQAAEKEKV